MDRVADYVLLRELGRGEHGEVHLARTPRRLGFAADTLAVKVLPLAGSDGFDALVDELSCFAALHCPHLVPMYDVGMDAGVVFYPMRHEPGGSLSAPARELTGREQLLAVARAARGAHEMHDAGLVHRGIGPYEHPARPGRRRPGRTVGPAPAGARVHGWRPGDGRPGRPARVRRPAAEEGVPGGPGERRLVARGDPAPSPDRARAVPGDDVRGSCHRGPDVPEEPTGTRRGAPTTSGRSSSRRCTPTPPPRFRTAADVAEAVEELVRRPGPSRPSASR